MRHELIRALGLAAFLAVGCSTPAAGDEFRPVSDRERERLELLMEARELGTFEDPGSLFTTLDQNLRSWRELSTASGKKEQLQLVSLEEAMTRLVYLNFDVLLETLRSGDPEHRMIAAAALGFSKIPAPDEPGGHPDFPQMHPRAIGPLSGALGEGNDQLTQNALLSLARLASPETPVDLLLEILVSHHNPAVRANAGLALAEVLEPRHRSTAPSYLYTALADPEPKVRLHSVSALGKLNEKSSVGQLLGVYTNDRSPLVQANAARVLGDLGAPEVIPYLVRGLTNQAPVIRFTCYHSLRKITGEDFGLDVRDWMSWYAANPSGP